VRNSEAPQEITSVETVWIPMADGTRLAARMWVPTSAQSHPVPAILEYTPYRRRDGSRDRDEQIHPWLAGHGYGCIRLDIRGTGDSEGVLRDEYLKQEQDDAVEAIAWIARQTWCSGAVGMMGISWGGFNALQVAAQRPPALKAIVTLCSTDDRYADDMHYMGGAQLTGNLEWGSTFFSIMARSPDPLIVGCEWRSAWMQRLQAVTPMIATSLLHQRRDAYWQHGSVCEDIAAITCPVMAVGGWADGYTNAVFRLLRDLKCPRLGIVGPWGHKYPHIGVPGPAIAFLTEMLQWWDHWLKGIATGVMQAPMLRVYIQEWISPRSHYDLRPGRWVAEALWPSNCIETKRLYCNRAGLGVSAIAGAALRVSSPQTIGAAGGEWCAYALGGIGPELPLDQRQDDSYSLTFDGAPLEAPLDLLGAPILNVAFRCDRPVMQIVVRLSDVSPEGEVARVTFGVLNLTHRNGHARPEKLLPGREYTTRVQLNDAGHRFAAGHHLRIAISTSYWPMVWPAPEQGCLDIVPGSTSLELPERKTRAEERVVVFGPPESLAPAKRTYLRTGEVFRRVEYDLGSGVQRIHVRRDDGRSIIDAIGVETEFCKDLRFQIHPSDPTSARAEALYELVHRHPEGWDMRIKTRSAIECTAADYSVEADLEAFEGERRVFSRSWRERIARDLT
jgi:putative CocE/NonD family hydrolase